MRSSKEFPFEKARRVSKKETNAARKAIERETGRPRKARRGRPPKGTTEKYVPIAIRLHPDILAWAKRVAKKKGVGYQTVINQILLERVA